MNISYWESVEAMSRFTGTSWLSPTGTGHDLFACDSCSQKRQPARSQARYYRADKTNGHSEAESIG